MADVLESQHLRMILEVARAQSVTRAADRLHVTPSAISHQLRDLEERLKTLVFVRAGRRMMLTPAGRVLADAAEHVLGALTQAEARVGQIARQGSGALTVCTQCYTGYSWLPSLVESLRRRHPEFSLQVLPEYTGDPISALLEGRLDLAIMNDLGDDPRLRHRELFDDEHVAVVPAAHRWATRPFITLEEVADEPLYLFSRSIENSFLVRNVLTPAGLAPRQMTHLQLPEGIIEMVTAGLGVTVLPLWSVAASLKSRRIVAVRLTRNGVFRKWYAVTLAGMPSSAFMDDFVRHLISQAPSPARQVTRRRR